MLYEKLKKLSAANFKHYCGVERETFEKMCELVRQKSTGRFLINGRPPKLVAEDRVLLTLEYWREYRYAGSTSERVGASVNRRFRALLPVSKIF